MPYTSQLTAHAESEDFFYLYLNTSTYPPNPGDPGHNDAMDAFRHAYTSGVYAMERGEEYANILGVANEILGDMKGQPPLERNMDLWNNRVGRELAMTATSKDDLAQKIAIAIGLGDLIIDPFTDGRTFDGARPNPTYLQLLDLQENHSDAIDQSELTRSVLSSNFFSTSEILDSVFNFYNRAETQKLDPLVIDLNNDGDIGLNTEKTVYFDMDRDGFAEAVNWISADDGLLVRDINENGNIDDSTELFGDATQSGFAALATLDINNDHVINSSDSAWADLKVWQDLNQDGQVEDGELLSLSSLGITAINLGSNIVNNTTDPGVTQDSTVTTTSGDIRISNVVFDADTVNTRYNEDYTLDMETLFLPTLRGYGKLPDLHIAASINTTEDANGSTIKDKLESLASLSLMDIIGNLDDVKSDIKSLIFQWAGHPDADNERGFYIDSRVLYFMESYLNDPFTDSMGHADPGLVQAENITAAFSIFLDKATSDIILQLATRELFSSDIQYNIAEDKIDNGFVLSEDTLSSLSDYAAGLSTTNDRAEFWSKVANLLYAEGHIYNGEDGMNQFGLTTDEEDKLEIAINDSDSTLVWYTEENLVGGHFSIEYAYFNESITTYVGTIGADTFTGTFLDEYATLGGSDDTANGGGGNDVIIGEDGNDTIHGGDGDDDIHGDGAYYWTGNDTLYGDDGDDHIEGDKGDDTIYGGDGNDHIWGDTDGDNASGGDDILDGGAGNDVIYGGKGDDILIDGYGTTGQNLLDGGDGANTYRIAGSAEVWIESTNGALTDVIELPSVYTDENDLSFERLGDNLHITGDIPGHEVDIYVINQVLAPYVEKIVFASSYEYSLTDAAFGIVGYGTDSDDTLQPYRVNLGEFYAYDDIIHGLGGDDTITGEYGNDTLYGDDGNDTLDGGIGNDTLYGGDGNDILTGGTGNDYLDGGAGDDVYAAGDSGNDTYVADGGDDVLVSDSGGTNIIEFGAGITFGDLTFSTALGDNLLVSYDGGSINIQKQFLGQGVTKFVFSDASEKLLTDIAYVFTITGTSGDDTIHGISNYWGTWRDYIYAGDGNDTITDTDGNNDIYGEGGNDTIATGDGDDKIYGGDGNDTINTGIGNNIVDGGAGDDNITTYSSGNNTVYTGEGHDTITMAYGYGTYTNTVYMADGIDKDSLVLTRSLSSGSGNDLTITIDSENSVFIKGWIFSSVVTVSQLNFADSSTLDLTHANIETYGTSGADTIYTLPTNGGKIFGLGGNDTLNDSTYNDNYLDGGDGNDVLATAYGGTKTFAYSNGFDLVYTTTNSNNIVDFGSSYALSDITFIKGASDYNLYIETPDGNEMEIYNNFYYGLLDSVKIDGITYNLADLTVVIDGSGTVDGTSGKNIIYGEGGANTLYGEDGNDILIGGSGNDTLDGGSGSDTASYITAPSSVTVNLSTGTATGGDGSDTLVSIESVTGSHYDDILIGNSGNNIITGGEGDDTLSGDAGNDTYLYTAGDGNDDVTDTSGFYDKISLTGIDFDDLEFTQSGSDLLISTDETNDNVITIEDFYNSGSNTIESLSFDDNSYYLLSNLLTGSTVATAVDDVIKLTGSGAISPGTGDDKIILSGADNVVTISRGDGHDIISNTTDDVNTVSFDRTLSPNELWFSSDGNDLVVRVLGEDQTVTIAGYFNDNDYGSNVAITSLGSYLEISRNDIITRAAHDVGSSYQPSGASNIMTNASMASYYSAYGIQSWTESASYTESGDIRFTTSSNDTVNSYSGDYLMGASGNDYILIYGSAGVPNYSYGDAGDDHIIGSINPDIMIGGLGVDWLEGWNGADTLYGGDGGDTLDGGDGDDMLYGGAGNDSLTGGNGIDTINYSMSQAAVTVNLGTSAATGGEGSDTLSSIENVVGSRFNDTITGSSSANVLYGGAGADSLTGGSGADVFKFASYTAFAGIDTITDFNQGQSDKIDLSDLLTSYDPLTDAITDFIQITASGSDSILKVDVDGGADNFVQIATITGVTGLTDEEALATNGTIIV